MPGIAVLAASSLVIVLAVMAGVRLRAVARVDTCRAVIVRLPPPVVWDLARTFPALYDAGGDTGEDGVAWTLRGGNGETAGSVWRGRCVRDRRPCWFDVEVIETRPASRLAMVLIQDSFGTHRGLQGHRATLSLEPAAPASTKVTWRLQAHLGLRLRWARIVSPRRLDTRLLNIHLRILKTRLENTAEVIAAAPAEPATGIYAPALRPRTKASRPPEAGA
jgi:hypothetical protein